jgi:hypothetical protein
LIGDTAFGKNVYLKYIALGKANKVLKNELDNEHLIKHSLTRKLDDALMTLRAERAIDKCHQDDIQESQGTVDKLECASDNLGLENRLRTERADQGSQYRVEGC